jgi:hypothetical protein
MVTHDWEAQVIESKRREDETNAGRIRRCDAVPG